MHRSAKPCLRNHIDIDNQTFSDPATLRTARLARMSLGLGTVSSGNGISSRSAPTSFVNRAATVARGMKFASGLRIMLVSNASRATVLDCVLTQMVVQMGH